MGDDGRQKRVGNYTPLRIKVLEKEIAERYAAGETLRGIAKALGINTAVVRRVATTYGIETRDKAAAGKALRRSFVPEDDPIRQKSVSDYVFELWIKTSGRENDSKKGLSSNREFRTACFREYRRRNYASYRELDARRKRSVNRMPKWANKDRIRQLYEMASDLGLSVDHIVPLQGENICGLHVENNLQLMSHFKNCSKTNVFACGPDPLIGRQSDGSAGPIAGPAKVIMSALQYS